MRFLLCVSLVQADLLTFPPSLSSTASFLAPSPSQAYPFLPISSDVFQKQHEPPPVWPAFPSLSSFTPQHPSWSTQFLQSARCEAEHFSDTVGGWARWFLGPGFPEPRYEHEFFHGPVHGDAPAASECAISEQWCRGLVGGEAQLKGLGEHLIAMILEPNPEGAMTTWELGVAPLMRSLLRPPSKASRVSMGGGSGAGFQVICGETILLTAGGGGGGGFDGRLATSALHAKRGNLSAWDLLANYGGGGGGGVQMLQGLVSESGWVSVGGGGGCGSDSLDPGLRCGSNTDGDMDEDRFSRRRGKLLEAMRLCASQGELVIIGGGGGGGGGGTGEFSGKRTRSSCCNFGIGYGFRFSLAYGHVNPAPFFEGRAEESALVSEAFSNAASKCGGYQDWKCVCEEVKRTAGSVAHLQCVYDQESGKSFKKAAHARRKLLVKSAGPKPPSHEFDGDFSSDVAALIAGPGPCDWLAAAANTSDDAGGVCHLNSTRHSMFIISGCLPEQWPTDEASTSTIAATTATTTMATTTTLTHLQSLRAITTDDSRRTTTATTPIPPGVWAVVAILGVGVALMVHFQTRPPHKTEEMMALLSSS